jgi:glycosyltransferase involved in cell wall biosynthesis
MYRFIGMYERFSTRTLDYSWATERKRSGSSETAQEPKQTMNFKNESIVCLAGEDWWYHNPHSNLHLMKAWAAENRILFVNSIGLRMPSFTKDRSSWKRVLGKLKSLLIFLRRAEPNIYVLTPIALPMIPSVRALVRAVNKVLLVVQLKLVMTALGFRRPVLWASLPTFKDAAVFLRKHGAKALAYYSVDNISHYSNTDQAYILSLDVGLQQAADVAFFVNHKLAEERAGNNPNTHYLPHGVDFEHFAKVQSGGLPVPPDLGSIPRPIAGYIGVIDGLDYELLKFLALKSPAVSFVLIGEVLEDTGAVAGVPNIFFLGKRPYESLPNYLQEFAVACIFYDTKDTFNNYRNPKKLKEYLATGKPVVSMPNLEMSYYADYVSIAPDYQAFHDFLTEAMSADKIEAREKRIAFAKRQTWDDVAAEAAARVLEYIDQRNVKTGP